MERGRIERRAAMPPFAGPAKLAIAALLLSCSAGSLAEVDGCKPPERPAVPDGSTASREDMLSGLQAVKVFQDHNMRYMKCLEERFDAARENAVQSPDPASRAIAQAVYKDAVDAYTAAVSAEEELAGDFNIELREFNALRR